jgi:hypothetical protein
MRATTAAARASVRRRQRSATVLVSAAVLAGLIGSGPVATATLSAGHDAATFVDPAGLVSTGDAVRPPIVHVWPGTPLQAVVDAHPEGTVFRIHGRHVAQSVSPKARQRFVGAPGAVLDGNGTTSPAFHGGAPRVKIVGLIITGYATRKQQGAINGSGRRWVVARNEIHHNATVGVRLVGNRSVIRGNNIHHNGQLGMSVAYARDAVVEDNEIAYNNWQVAFSWGWEAGGTKFWSTENLVVRGNWSHHNHGPGLWSDKDNIGILYEGNRVEDNYAAGIFHEIGYDAVIRHNVIRRNGFGHARWLWGAGIVIASSQNVEVYRNRVVGNHNGITVTQQNRGAGKHGPYLARNIRVHRNTVVDSGRTGAAQDIGSNDIFSSNIRFTRNVYRGELRWVWDNREIGWPAWRGFGLDINGSYAE